MNRQERRAAEREASQPKPGKPLRRWMWCKECGGLISNRAQRRRGCPRCKATDFSPVPVEQPGRPEK